MSNKNLTDRTAALKLIKDIRQTRQVIKSGKLDADMVYGLNGSNGALESLLGHVVTVEDLDEQGKINLLREILGRLTEEEYKAVQFVKGKLRDYFADITASFSQYLEGAGTESLINGLNFRVNKPMLDSYVQQKPAHGCYSLEGLKTVKDSVDVFCEFLDTITPVVERIYDEEVLETENGDDSGATAAPPEKIEPDPAEAEPIEHEILVDPNQEALKDIIEACNTNRSMSTAVSKFVNDPTSLEALGYKTKEDVIGGICCISGLRRKLAETVMKFRNLWSEENLTTLNLTAGSDKLFDAVDSVVGLINRTDVVRDRLDATMELLSGVVPTVK